MATFLKDRQAQVNPVLTAEDNHLKIASLLDLLATKLNTIQFRAQTKDYMDIHALLKHGLSLADGLAASIAVYGPHFDPGSSLRALCSYRDGDLPELPQAHAILFMLHEPLSSSQRSCPTIPDRLHSRLGLQTLI